MNWKEGPVWSRLDGVFAGAGYAALIGGMAITQHAPLRDDLFYRMLLGLALGILAKRMIDGAQIEMAASPRPKGARLVYGWALGAGWGLAMMLTFWPLTGGQIIVWTLGAVFFGSGMAGLYKSQPVSAARAAFYDLDRPFRDGWYGTFRLLTGPIAVVVVLVFLFWSLGNSDPSKLQRWPAIAVILVSIFAPFPYRDKWMRVGHLTTMVGVVIIAFSMNGWLP